MNEELPEGFKSTEIGPIPEEWEVVKVSEIAEKLRAGGTPSRKESKYWGGDIPFVLIEDMTSTGLYLSNTREYITEEGLSNSSAWIVPSNSLLLSMYATIGETAINAIPLATNQAILAILPKSNFDIVYGAYRLKYDSKRLLMQNVQSTQKNVNKGIVENFRISLPPLPEQKKIATVLSAVQLAKEKTEDVIKGAKEFKKSLMKHLFTYGPVPVEEAENVPLKETEIGIVPEEWEVAKIEDIAYVNKENMDPTKEMPDTHFTYIDIAGVEGDTGRIVEAKKILGRNAPSRARRVIHTKDIILSTVRPYLKSFAIVPEEYDNQICSTGFAVLTSKGAIIPEYLLYISYSNLVGKQFESQMRGANYPAINAGHVKHTKIPLPPPLEQENIANMLTAVHSKIEVEENRKKALEDFFKTLLHDLMTAKIRVINLEIET